MMSKKQWFVLLCVYVTYLLLGAAVFYEIESAKELRALLEERTERITIEELLVRNYIPEGVNSHKDIFEKISNYCGKPLSANMSEEIPPLTWDYYHSIFFVITVVSTIGYGNLSPTTTATRIFTILYAIVGMPMNGMLIINLGDHFGKSFLKLYDRWKTKRVQHALATLGLVGQVVLYLIPGFTFFIFIPSILIMVYESWSYDAAVYYAFITLTTIGFGDLVAGSAQNDRSHGLYMAYKIFLLVWIISGLGYLCMVMGFVARGMQSKKLRAIEHKLALNIKRTNNKIRQELQSIVNDYLFLKVKRVYREKFIYVPNKPQRSQSCPNLSIYSTPESPATIARKRAFSTCFELSSGELTKYQSDSDLDRIDKEQTFNPTHAVLEPGQLLLRVANALGNIHGIPENNRSSSYSEGVDLFSSNDILASENRGSGLSIDSDKPSAVLSKRVRRRAVSECRGTLNPTGSNENLTWYGPSATKRLQELREQVEYNKVQHKSLPPFTPSTKPQSLLSRLKNSFAPNKDEVVNKNVDVENQNFQNEASSYDTYTLGDRKLSMFASQNEAVLEQTSIADLLRALTAMTVPESIPGEYEATPTQIPNRLRRQPIPCPQRRISLTPFSSAHETHNRRYSLRPEVDIGPPPPYYPINSSSNLTKRTVAGNRRFSLRPTNTTSGSSSLHRSLLKLKYPVTQDSNLKDIGSKSTSNV